jgi:hypothetical protein
METVADSAEARTAITALAPLVAATATVLVNHNNKVELLEVSWFLIRFVISRLFVSNTIVGNRDAKSLPYHLDKADIQADLTGQRPIYPLSCYSPGRDTPRQLIEGPVEISPEELRCRFYMQRAAGNEQLAVSEHILYSRS